MLEFFKLLLGFEPVSLFSQDASAVARGGDDAAIMFCYFNDTAAFLQYLRGFRGRLLLVAGPGEGAPAHCHPQPFSRDIPAAWSLQDSMQVPGTQDFVAVYSR